MLADTVVSQTVECDLYWVLMADQTKNISELSLELHKSLRGKVSMRAKDSIEDAQKLSLYYTPGVGAVSSYVAKHPAELRWQMELLILLKGLMSQN